MSFDTASFVFLQQPVSVRTFLRSSSSNTTLSSNSTTTTAGAASRPIPTAAPSVGGTTTSSFVHRDENRSLVSRASFLDDLLSAFPHVKVPHPSSHAPSNDDDFVLLDSDMDCLTLDTNNNNNKTSSTTTDPTASITTVHLGGKQWDLVWRQFSVDIPREQFVVDGRQYREAGAAYSAVTEFLRSSLAAREKEALVREETRQLQQQAQQHATTTSWNWIKKLLLFGSYSSSNSTAPTAAELEQKQFAFHRTLEQASRLVILLSQQSVLAVPYEAICHQFTSGCEGEVFVGEISSKATPIPSIPSAMCVELSNRHPTKLGESGCDPQLIVQKSFRIFALEEDRDVTLFYVRVTVTISLFDSDEPISVGWSVLNPIDGTLLSASRSCECLGASAGFHHSTCSLRR